MSILKVVDEKLARRQIAEPYEAGSANDSMLKDIGVMYKCGIQDSDIVEICSIKMKDRGRKRKSDNEIRRAVALWDERSSHIRPPRPLVDPRSFFLIAGGG